MRDVFKSAYNKLGYELTRLKCNIPMEDPTHDRDCARCNAIHKHHAIKWEAENRRSKP